MDIASRPSWRMGAAPTRCGSTVPSGSKTGRSSPRPRPRAHTSGYLALLTAVAQANPTGDLSLIADNLSSHTSRPIQDWLAEHPRVHPLPLPVGASWLNLIEGWWRIFRRKAFAGQDCRQSPGLGRRHPSRDPATQCPRPALDLGAPTTAAPHAPSPVRVLPLTNGALVRQL